MMKECYILFCRKKGQEKWEAESSARRTLADVEGNLKRLLERKDIYFDDGEFGNMEFKIAHVELEPLVSKTYGVFRRSVDSDYWELETTCDTHYEAEKELYLRRQNWTRVDGIGKHIFQIREIEL